MSVKLVYFVGDHTLEYACCRDGESEMIGVDIKDGKLVLLVLPKSVDFYGKAKDFLRESPTFNTVEIAEIFLESGLFDEVGRLVRLDESGVMADFHADDDKERDEKMAQKKTEMRNTEEIFQPNSSHRVRYVAGSGEWAEFDRTTFKCTVFAEFYLLQRF